MTLALTGGDRHAWRIFPLSECDAAVRGNRGAAVSAKPSAELVHDLRRDELEMVEVMQVEHLKIDPVGTHF